MLMIQVKTIYFLMFITDYFFQNLSLIFIKIFMNKKKEILETFLCHGYFCFRTMKVSGRFPTEMFHRQVAF